MLSELSLRFGIG